MTGGRKRKAITPNSKDCAPPPPPKRTLRSASIAAKAAADAAEARAAAAATAAAAAAAEEPSIDFIHLPFHFLVQVADHLTFDEMNNYRLACSATKEAVDHWGRSQRALPVKQMLLQLWPGRFAAADFHFDSLYNAKDEMRKLSTWFAFDLLTSIDFDGVSNICEEHLKTTIGEAPLERVTKVNVVGCVVMPDAWTEMSRLFPRLKTVKLTEARVQFPEEMTKQLALIDRPLAPNLFVNQKKLAESGALQKERILTLRCLKHLFKSVRHTRIE